jgi:peptidoglycan/LPS O-acetylase OafA/YrhL
MRKATSLYLDLVRFAAALTVFVEHFKEHTRHGFQAFWDAHPYLYWHLMPYSQTAVTVFFVLSGYVIAHVLASRERTPLEYAASRFARLYSVVVPALLLIAACNFLIELRYPNAFGEFESDGTARVALSYFGTALFVNCFWLWPNIDLPNGPFWTLSFEASYYVAIAIFVFAGGRTWLFCLIGLALLTGPTIVLLAPVWLLGYLAYHLQRRLQIHPAPAVVVWLASIILLPFCCLLQFRYREHLTFLRTPDQAVGEILATYAAAICFTLNLLAFDTFGDRLLFLVTPFTTVIRWLGSITFALYLFHQPLLSLFTVYHMPDRSSTSQLMLLVGGTFLVIATFGHFCESTKGVYKRFFTALLALLANRVATLGWASPPDLQRASPAMARLDGREE